MQTNLKVVAVLLAAAISAGCAEDPQLVLGQQTWDQTCKVCHLNGIAGAPPKGNVSAWKPRIAKGEAVLINNALNGFEGSEGVMPARGGNNDLTDAEVIAAVKYMVSVSQE